MKKIVVTGMVVVSLGLTSGAWAGSACCSMSKNTSNKSESTTKAAEKKISQVATEKGIEKEAAKIASTKAE